MTSDASSDSEIQQLRSELAQLRGEVDRLNAIEAVKRVKHKYWRSFDTADFEPFPKDTGNRHPPGEMPPFLDTK